jgi:hypothetical protein
VEQRKKNNAGIQVLDNKKIEVFTLTEGVHPNSNDESALKNISLLLSDFNRLNYEIQAALNRS